MDVTGKIFCTSANRLYSFSKVCRQEQNFISLFFSLTFSPYFFSFANCHENQSVIQHQSLSKFYLTEYLVGIAYTNNFLFWLGSHNLTCSAGDLHENLDSMNLSVLLDTNRENMFYFMTILLLKIIIAIYFE